MRTSLQALLVLFLILAACSCRRHDYRTRVISVPGLKNEQCGAVISNAVAALCKLPSMGDAVLPGSIRFDYQQRTVTVDHDSMKLALKNLEHQIASHGFAANNTPAYTDAVSRLPPDCR